MSDEERLRQRIEAQIAARRAGAAPRRREAAARGAHEEPAQQAGESADESFEAPPLLEPARPWAEDDTSRLAALSEERGDTAEPVAGPASDNGSRILEPIRPWLLRPQPAEWADQPGAPESHDMAVPGEERALRPVRPWLARPHGDRPDAVTADAAPAPNAHSGRPEPQVLPLTPEMLDAPATETTGPVRHRGLHLPWRHHHDDEAVDGPVVDAAQAAAVEEAAQRLADAERRIAAAEQRLAEVDQLAEASRQAEIQVATAERDAEAQRRAEAEYRLAEAEQRLAEAQEAARVALAAESERLAALERESAATREQAAHELELARAAQEERIRQALEERAVEAQRRAFAEQQLAEAEQRMTAVELAAEEARRAEAERVAEQIRQTELAQRLELQRRLEETERRLAEAEHAAEAALLAEPHQRVDTPPFAHQPEPAEHREYVSAEPQAPGDDDETRPLALARLLDAEPPRHAAPPPVPHPRESLPFFSAGPASAVATGADEAAPPKGKLPLAAMWIRLAVVLVVVVLSAVLVRTYVIGSYYIPSGSMEPTLHGCEGCNNDHVLVNKLSYKMHAINRGDVVVFHRPEGASVRESVLIKRVIGLPGDVLSDRDGVLYVNGLALNEPYINPKCHGTVSFPARSVTVPEGRLFVMGDNRCDSSDSRAFGTISEDSVIGRAFIIIWPLGRIHYL